MTAPTGTNNRCFGIYWVDFEASVEIFTIFRYSTKGPKTKKAASSDQKM